MALALHSPKRRASLPARAHIQAATPASSLKRSAVVIAATLTVLWNVQPSASVESEGAAVRIRILDYARIPKHVIAQAQRRATDIYRTIGVQIRWQATVRPREASSLSPESLAEPSDFAIIVLSQDMSRCQSVAPDVVGMAIVPPQGGGRIAYVLFDRVRLVARAAQSDVTDILGMVMAHEIGHLMLPYGSHSDNGLMRADWNVKELHRPMRAAFDFTIQQGHMIRSHLRQWAPVPSANATQ